MFRRVERQVESNDCLSLFSDVSRETLTFCPLNIKKKFPLKGGFVRQKHLGKMILIDFFDVNQRFVVRHKIEFDEPRKYAFMAAFTYCRAIFSWYEDACTAVVLIDNNIRIFRRYE